MIKCEVVEKFTLKNYNELKNIQRKSLDQNGTLYVGDTFECSKEMCEYLTGKNPLNKIVVKVLEIIQEEEHKNAIKEQTEYTKEKELKVTSKPKNKKKK